MAKEVVVTREGYNKLEQELENLRTVKRKEVADKIKVARGYGDLSENAEYDAAKEEQASVEARIADLEATLKLARIMEVRQMSEDVAKIALLRHDRERKAYHNHYSKMKWGDSRNYSMCINSSVLGLEATADIMEQFVREKMKEHQAQ